MCRFVCTLLLQVLVLLEVLLLLVLLLTMFFFFWCLLESQLPSYLFTVFFAEELCCCRLCLSLCGSLSIPWLRCCRLPLKIPLADDKRIQSSIRNIKTSISNGRWFLLLLLVGLFVFRLSFSISSHPMLLLCRSPSSSSLHFRSHHISHGFGCPRWLDGMLVHIRCRRCFSDAHKNVLNVSHCFDL